MSAGEGDGGKSFGDLMLELNDSISRQVRAEVAADIRAFILDQRTKGHMGPWEGHVLGMGAVIATHPELLQLGVVKK